ncbi:stage II sporulation protein M [Anaerocolumna xylanovorans]|uniref:Stage II sporulation protein M n=1 Tax=Anaerocolumna xylanovorans DSM 12503 TaxID=1121345 RepID=A0A1M7YBY7_9FIRM|nr:stage II sporulation protein M [Anaerocolumna xylanovorans]SHO50028.1 stage II sporulation protein M [Anaerocolumna xylanovorans DSM 12503]
MNYLKQQLRKLGEIKAGLLLVAFGAVLGILFARIFKDFYWGNINILNSDYLYQIKTTPIEHSVLLKYVYWDIYKNFILFWLVCITSFGLPFIGLCLTYIGFQGSLFVTVILMRYKLKGILLIIGYTFPQYLIYIPVIFISLRLAFWLNKSLRYESLGKKGKREKILRYLALAILLGIVLAVGGLLETYIGSFILRKLLYFF